MTTDNPSTTLVNDGDLDDIVRALNKTKRFIEDLSTVHPIDSFSITIYDAHGVYVLCEIFWDSESETLKTDLARYGSA